MRPEGKENIERLPSEYFKLLYFDSLVHGGFALNYLVESVGAERVMMGTDYPFDMGDYASVDHVMGLARASDADRFAILGDTAQQLFRI